MVGVTTSVLTALVVTNVRVETIANQAFAVVAARSVSTDLVTT